VAIAAGYAYEDRFSMPVTAVVAVVMVAPVVYITIVMSKSRRNAFAVNGDGIRLGTPRNSPRRERLGYAEIPWSAVREVRISPAPRGTAVDVLLAESAPGSGSRTLPAPVQIVMAAIPGSYLLLKPPLLCRLAGPARYHVPLDGVAPPDVVAALRSRAPASVPVTEALSPVGTLGAGRLG
jgi:hypothetical protein